MGCEGEEAVFLEGDAVELVDYEEEEEAADEGARVEDDEAVGGCILEHGVDVCVTRVVCHPGRGGPGEVQGGPGLCEELRGGEADAVEAEVEEEPGEGGRGEGAPVALCPEELDNVLVGEAPVGVEGCGLDEVRVGAGAE